jgi:adenylate kinase
MKKERLGFHLVLLGQITSGKDTQAKLLQKKYSLIPVESGKYWRNLAKQKSKEGKWLLRTTGQGKPAPVILMKKFLLDQINKKPKNKELIFIGNPRLKPEAQLLKKIMLDKKENFFAIYISLSEKEILRRSLKRERDYLDQKHIKTRIKWHNEQVGKTVKYFESLGKLKKINGNQPIEKVQKDINRAIAYFRKINNDGMNPVRSRDRGVSGKNIRDY